jgi:hypothetical protein
LGSQSGAEPPPIHSVEQVRKRLEQLGVREACEVCGSDVGWLIPAEDDGRLQTLFAVTAGGGASFYAAICRNCTNTRLFPAHLLMRPEVSG